MCALRRLPRRHLAPAVERYQSLRGARLYLDDLEAIHRLLQERARRVVLRVGEDGVADEVEDLRGTDPADLDYVCFITEGPSIKVRLGSVPYASALDDTQGARELARDVHSLVVVRKRPRWQSLAVRAAGQVLGYGPGAAFLAVLLSEVLGLISPTDHDRALIGGLMLPAVVFGFAGFALTFKYWLRVDYETQVVVARRQELRTLALQGRVGAKWSTASGLVMGVAGVFLGLLTALLTGFFGLKT